MAGKCMVCGKSAAKLASSANHPDKRVCLDCLNGLVFNAGTLAKEMEPITKAFAKAFKEITESLDNK